MGAGCLALFGLRCGLFFFLLLFANQKYSGLASCCTCCEDRAFVVLQHLQPVPDIAGMLQLAIDAAMSAQKGGSQLCNQFLERIATVPETSIKIACKAACVACPVGELMKSGRVVVWD